jgi:hypothetical protein
VLRTLTRLLRGRRDGSQLELGLADAAPKNADELLALLRRLGLSRLRRCRLTRNRNVMVSFGSDELRVHEGYLGAPEHVLRAIVTFVEGATRAERRAAQRVIVVHPIRAAASPARRDRTHPDDVVIAEKLAAWHQRFNVRHFHGRLRHVPIRVSRRMKSRLGHYTARTAGGEPAEIAISRAHLRRHGWEETLHTLLHEMVHQWQDETNRTIDHGATFRAKAREVGIEPYARRVLATRPGRAEGSQTLGRRAARDG